MSPDPVATLVEASNAYPPDWTTSYGEHPDQVIDFRGIQGSPVVVVIHGGFWRPGTGRAHAGAMSAALAKRCLVATIEYRRIPGEPDATLADVRAAIAFAAREAPGGHLTLVGHSAGGHLALLTAGDPPREPWSGDSVGVDGVVALAPVADLGLAEQLGLGSGAVRAFLGAAAAGRPDLDPMRSQPVSTPVEILHGDADTVVPLSITESFASVHAEATVRVLHGADHFAVIDPGSTHFACVVHAVGRHAGGSPARDCGA